MTHAVVGPAAVHQQEPPQVPKLCKGVIWCQNRLHPLLTADADTDVSSWGRNTDWITALWNQNRKINIKTEVYSKCKLCSKCHLTLKSMDRYSDWLQLNIILYLSLGQWVRLTLDHADVIGSISNGQGDGPLVPLHQLHHLGFLHRSDPAADDCFTQTGHVQQDVL